MRGIHSFGISSAVMVVAYACGGGSGGDSTHPITPESAREPCEWMCQREIDCGSGETLAECAERCMTSVAGWAREDAFTDVAECVAALPCETDDDQCFAVVSPLSIHETWQRECSTKLACEAGQNQVICSIDSGGFGIFVKMFVPEVVEQMLDCLDSGASCDARLDCIETVLDTNHVNL